MAGHLVSAQSPVPLTAPSNLTFVVVRIATLVVTALVFLPILGFTFNLATDDLFFIWLNPSIKNTSISGLVEIVASTNEAFNEFQPLPFISYWMDYALFGMQPYGYYLTQLILHLINVVLVFTVIQAVSGNRALAVIVGLVFGIHPLQADTVAMLNQRENLLATFFGLLAILSYVRWRASRSAWEYGLCAILFVMSLLSEASWVVLPVLLVFVDYYQGDVPSLAMLRNKAPLFAISALSVLLALYSQTSAGMTTPFLFGSLATQCRLIVMLFYDYVVSFFVPIRLSTSYTYRLADLYSWKMALAALTVGCLFILLLVRARKGLSSVVFGLSWFVVCLLPVIQIIPFQIVRADRYMYHSMIGLALVAGSVLLTVTGAPRRRWAFIVILSVIVLALAPLTSIHLQNYSTSVKYVHRFVQDQGWNPSAEALLGRVYFFRGRYEMAARLLRSAVAGEEEPRKSARRLELAEVYRKMGRLEDARAELQRVPADSPVKPKVSQLIREINRGLRGRSEQKKNE